MPTPTTPERTSADLTPPEPPLHAAVGASEILIGGSKVKIDSAQLKRELSVRRGESRSITLRLGADAQGATLGHLIGDLTDAGFADLRIEASEFAVETDVRSSESPPARLDDEEYWSGEGKQVATDSWSVLVWNQEDRLSIMGVDEGATRSWRASDRATEQQIAKDLKETCQRHRCKLAFSWGREDVEGRSLVTLAAFARIAAQVRSERPVLRYINVNVSGDDRSGLLPPRLVEGTIYDDDEALEACYEALGDAMPEYATLRARFEIRMDGLAHGLVDAGSDTVMAPVLPCLLERLKSLRYVTPVDSPVRVFLSLPIRVPGNAAREHQQNPP